MTKPKQIPQTRAYTVLKKTMPMFAESVRGLEAHGKVSLDKPIASELAKLLAKIPASTLTVVDSTLASLTSTMWSATKSAIASIDEPNVKADLMPVAAFLLRSFKFAQPSIRHSQKPAKRRAKTAH